jgi:uncharacterized protein YrrD
MIQRASQVIGKSVMAADNGEKLGTVADLLFDDTNRQLIGLVINQGLLHSEQVLLADAVQAFGRDAVVSSSRTAMISARDWREKQKTPEQGKG